MPISDFCVLGKLGQGAYSKVYKVERKADKTVYALKKVILDVLSEKQLQNALNQVRILASLNYQQIVGYKEAFVENGSLFLVTEFCIYGDLKERIGFHKKYETAFSEEEIWNVVTKTLEGLKKLHSLNILHRDIKSANIFLTKNKNPKIGDFNISKVNTTQFRQTQAGTPFYASPEVWSKTPYDSKSDIWSLGCVFFQMATLKLPFKGKNLEELQRKVCTENLPNIKFDYSKNLKLLIKSMLNQDARKRPSADRLLKFIYDKQICEKKEEKKEKSILLETIRWSDESQCLTDRLPQPKYERESYFQKERKRKMQKLRTEKSENLPQLQKASSNTIVVKRRRENILSDDMRNLIATIERGEKGYTSIQAKRLKERKKIIIQ